MPDDTIDLVSVLDQLREDLAKARLNAAKAPGGPMLALGKAEVEMQLVVEGKKEGGGGIKFSVLALGAKASKTRGQTHRLKLELEPLKKEGIASQNEGQYEAPPPTSD
ncbi:trypco2 family protein [Streptomyces sp. NPDC059649]|uniref:trypco2 family protein n=1 Tax=Streptomyces sp. NPDC059649 TaxID=3346895 RepID=UPI0036ADE238